MTTPPLTYHQKVFDLLQRTPTFDPNAEAKLRAVEDAYGLILPPSVREWYSLNEAIPILREFENCTYFVTLEEMVKFAPRWFAREWFYESTLDLIQEYKCPTLPIGWDYCAGVVLIALAIKDNNTPLVVSYVDGAGWCNNDQTFSEFTLNWVYNCLDSYEGGYQARAYKAVILEHDYQIIKQYFIEKPSIPPIRIFEYDDQIIYSWRGYFDDNEISFLWLCADTPQSFRDLLKRMWNIGNLATELYAVGWGDCQAIFEEFRPMKRQNPPTGREDWDIPF